MKKTLILSLILFSILFTAGTSTAADPVDKLDKKYETLKSDGLLRLHRRHFEELLEVRERAMADRDLALANKADATIESLKAGVFTLDPSVAWAAPPTASRLVGKWIFRSNTWSGIRDFRPDGTIDAGIDGPGKWKILGNDLIVEYANGASATFELPVRGGELPGKSGKGELMTATKISSSNAEARDPTGNLIRKTGR